MVRNSEYNIKKHENGAAAFSGPDALPARLCSGSGSAFTGLTYARSLFVPALHNIDTAVVLRGLVRADGRETVNSLHPWNIYPEGL